PRSQPLSSARLPQRGPHDPGSLGTSNGDGERETGILSRYRQGLSRKDRDHPQDGRSTPPPGIAQPGADRFTGPAPATRFGPKTSPDPTSTTSHHVARQVTPGSREAPDR